MFIYKSYIFEHSCYLCNRQTSLAYCLILCLTFFFFINATQSVWGEGVYMMFISILILCQLGKKQEIFLIGSTTLTFVRINGFPSRRSRFKKVYVSINGDLSLFFVLKIRFINSFIITSVIT